MAGRASTVVIAKKGNVTRFAMKTDPPDDASLLENMLGPTGNLRAPTIRKGKTLLVGFDEASYLEFLS